MRPDHKRSNFVSFHCDHHYSLLELEVGIHFALLLWEANTIPGCCFTFQVCCPPLREYNEQPN